MIDSTVIQNIEIGKRLVESLLSIKHIHYRELYPDIDHHNFHICTKVDFRKIFTEDVETTWKEILTNNESLLSYTSATGSRYLVNSVGEVYRFSDHWGAVSSCEWSLDGTGNFMMSEFITGEREIGIAKMENFKIFRRKQDRNVDILLNPEWKERILELLPVCQMLENLKKEPSFAHRPLEEKKLIGESFGFFQRTLKEATV